MMLTTLPSTFVDRLYQIWPKKQVKNILDSLGQPKAVSFRVNTLKTTDQAVLDRLAQADLVPEPIEGIPHAYYLPPSARETLTHHPLFDDGAIYLQNPSSMLASLILDPAPGEEILDLTAAPGGKTLHLACLMQNTGRIGAVEVSKNRFHRLKANIAKSGATEIQCYLKDGAKVGRDCPERFDRVLLDAPCSSESRFNPADPETYRYWDEKKIADCARKQKRLAYSAALALKPGGVLVYATCTFAPEENEMILDYLLTKFPTLEMDTIDLPTESTPGLTRWQKKVLNPAVGHTQRVLPTRLYNGFFIAKLRKG